MQHIYILYILYIYVYIRCSTVCVSFTIGARVPQGPFGGEGWVHVENGYAEKRGLRRARCGRRETDK